MERAGWRLSIAGAWACTVAVLVGASPARAGECAVDTFQLRGELAFPTYTGGTIGFDQPFAVVLQTLLSMNQNNSCDNGCPSNPSTGESECGDLVTTPVDVDEGIAGFEMLDFAGYEGRLLANGTWEANAGAFLVAPTSSDVTFANINFSFGHREVFDVTSAASEPQPFRLRIRDSAVVPAGVLFCPGVWRVAPLVPSRMLRVRSLGSGQFLVDSLLGGSLGVPPDRVVIEPGTDPDYQRLTQEWDFDIDVPANTVLFVDLLYDQIGGTFQAPVSDPISQQDCPLTVVVGDWRAPEGGVQLQVSPGPELSAVARSGIVYAPVPEPGALASGVAALAALAYVRRRSSAR